MKLKNSPTLPLLEKGQLWKTKTSHVEIMQVGKTLTYYRIFEGEKKRVPTSYGSIQMVQDYLTTNGATRVKNDRLTKA
jgi:hypothetical protein